MSRRARRLIITLCLAVVFLIIYLDRMHAFRPSGHSYSRPTMPYATDEEKYNGKIFTVVKVVDGDTLDINLPDDFTGKHYKSTRIRLLGVDTPETKKPNTPVMYYGPEASEFAKETALGQQVTILLDDAGPSRDKYGRLLAYVRLPDGRVLDEILITEGYGYADLRFRHSLYKQYEQDMYRAKKAQKGLWKNVTEEQFPDWLQRMRPTLVKKAA
jgi:endonuclease YncB( thermonuclease family)